MIFVAYELNLPLNMEKPHHRSQRAGEWSLIWAHDSCPIYPALTYIAVPLLGPHQPRYIGLTLYYPLWHSDTIWHHKTYVYIISNNGLSPVWWQAIAMMSSNGNIFRITGPLCGEFTGHRWIPLTKASGAELCFFLWFAPELLWLSKQSSGWWFETPSPSLWRHRNGLNHCRLSIRSLVTNFNEILIEIQNFSRKCIWKCLQKCCLQNMSFCSGLSVLNVIQQAYECYFIVYFVMTMLLLYRSIHCDENFYDIII